MSFKRLRQILIDQKSIDSIPDPIKFIIWIQNDFKERSSSAALKTIPGDKFSTLFNRKQSNQNDSIPNIDPNKSSQILVRNGRTTFKSKNKQIQIQASFKNHPYKKIISQEGSIDKYNSERPKRNKKKAIIVQKKMNSSSFARKTSNWIPSCRNSLLNSRNKDSNRINSTMENTSNRRSNKRRCSLRLSHYFRRNKSGRKTPKFRTSFNIEPRRNKNTFLIKKFVSISDLIDRE